jgi:hypothetical protein
MLLQVDFEISFTFAETTPVLLMTYLHPSRDATVRSPEQFSIEPQVPVSRFMDSFGNRCGRAVLPPGLVVFRNHAIIEDSGLPDLQVVNAPQSAVQDLPDAMLQFLLPSRYCEVDSELKDLAWNMFKALHPDGRECRRSAISFTDISASIISRRDRLGRLLKRIGNVWEFVAITCTSQSRSVVV